MVHNVLTFGPFRLDLGRRELQQDDVRVRLGGRAVDILCVLASAKGEVVSKDELMRRVWPDLVVEENNLQVHISALRKAIDGDKSGQSYLVTVPGRGYRLVGCAPSPIAVAGDDPAGKPQSPAIPDKPSIAVLPFQNLSGDAEQEY